MQNRKGKAMNKEEFKLKIIEQFKMENGKIRFLPLCTSTYGIFRKYVSVSCSEFKLAIDIWWDDRNKNFTFEFTDKEEPLEKDNDLSSDGTWFYRKKYFVEYFKINGNCIKFGYLSANFKHKDYDFYMTNIEQLIGLTIDLSENKIMYYGCQGIDEFSKYVNNVIFRTDFTPVLAYNITQKDVDVSASRIHRNIRDKEMVGFITNILTEEADYRGDAHLLETMISMIQKLEIMMDKRT